MPMEPMRPMEFMEYILVTSFCNCKVKCFTLSLFSSVLCIIWLIQWSVHQFSCGCPQGESWLTKRRKKWWLWICHATSFTSYFQRALMSVSITFQKDLFGKEELSIVYGVFHMGIGLGALIVPFITGQLESMLKRKSQGKK